MTKRDDLCNDTRLIDCEWCKKILNGENLWVIGEGDEAVTICEECYSERMRGAKPNERH